MLAIAQALAAAKAADRQADHHRRLAEFYIRRALEDRAKRYAKMPRIKSSLMAAIGLPNTGDRHNANRHA